MALVAAAAAAFALGVGLAVSSSGDSPQVLFEPDFGGPDRLIGNEYALHHPHSPVAVRSSQWTVTSGSLFVGSGAATNGPLDDRAADPRSRQATNSAVFRAYSKRRFAPDYRVVFEVRVGPPRAVTGLQPAPWDGLHLMLDAESPEAAYYVSIYRRNGQAVIKKKTPGGTVAGGSYEPLSRYVPDRIEPGRWTPVRVDVRRAGPESVTIDLYENGILLTTATDGPSTSDTPPFSEGHVGIRADKTSFAIRAMRVESL